MTQYAGNTYMSRWVQIKLSFFFFYPLWLISVRYWWLSKQNTFRITTIHIHIYTYVYIICIRIRCLQLLMKCFHLIMFIIPRVHWNRQLIVQHACVYICLRQYRYVFPNIQRELSLVSVGVYETCLYIITYTVHRITRVYYNSCSDCLGVSDAVIMRY